MKSFLSFYLWLFSDSFDPLSNIAIFIEFPILNYSAPLFVYIFLCIDLPKLAVLSNCSFYVLNLSFLLLFLDMLLYFCYVSYLFMYVSAVYIFLLSLGTIVFLLFIRFIYLDSPFLPDNSLEYAFYKDSPNFRAFYLYSTKLSISLICTYNFF